MSRNFVEVPVQLIRASRVCFQPVSRASGGLWKRPSQYPLRSYSSSGALLRDRRNVKHLELDYVADQTEDTSAQDELTTTKREEDKGSPQITESHPMIRTYFSPAPPDEFPVDAHLDIWVAKSMNYRRTRESSFKAGRDIRLRVLNFKKDHGIAVSVALEYRAAANALDSDLLASLTEVFDKLASNQSIHGVCLTSSESTFCAGAHTKDLLGLQGRKTANTFIRKISRLCTAIRDTPVPVVACVSGACIGAGLEMAASCDIRVATKDATFSMPEVHLGIPSVVQARLLCDIVGWGRARHLMLTGHTWTAQEAYEAGLVTKLFDDKDHMMNWASAYMKQVNKDTDVYRTQKKLMRGWENQSVDGGIEAGAQCFASAFAKEEDVRNIQHAIRRAISARIKAKEDSKKNSGALQVMEDAIVVEDEAVDEVQDDNDQQTPEEQPTEMKDKAP